MRQKQLATMVLALPALAPFSVFAAGEGSGTGSGRGNGDGTGGGNTALELVSSEPADGAADVSLTPENRCVFPIM